jgi:hypothetical protein
VSSQPNTVAISDFVADNDATDYRLTVTLTGWNDAASVRSAISERSQQDGGWDAAGLFGPRLITVEGVVDQATHADAMAVADQLTALSPFTLHEFIVDNEAVGPRSALVRVTQGAVLEWLNGECFTYSITLTAPDPLKYGPATIQVASLADSAGGAGLAYPLAYPLDYGLAPGVTPGALTVTNAGTASYFPRLRVDGPVTNPVVTLVETGDWVRYNGTVPAGQHLDINWGNPRRATIGDNPVSVRHLVTFSGNWLAVPAGGGSMTFSADTTDPDSALTVWGYEGAWL